MNWRDRDILVVNCRGVHGRVATAIARLTQQHDATLRIRSEDGMVDCSSVLDMLSMAFTYGSRLHFQARGREADQLLEAVATLLSAGEGSLP